MVAPHGTDQGGRHDRQLADEGLWRAFGRSARSNLFAECGVQAIRICGFIVLARLLAPPDFGILRVLVAICVIATMLNTVGIPETLIQRPELTADHEATAWWMSVGMALLTAILLYTCAPLVARLMAMPALVPFVRLLSIPIFFGGMTAVANARLRRRFQFATIAAADVLGEVGFLSVALTLILLGQRFWSLAGGLAARVGIQAATLGLSERYWPRRLPRRAAFRDLAGFSTTVLGGRLLTGLAGNADYLMVGRLLGPAALGFYGVAWDLLRFIPDRLYSVAGRVMLPAFCALQRDRAALAKAYCDFINYVARLILPPIACAAIAAPQLITLIYGAQWAPAAMPMRLLAAGLALFGLRMAIGSVYFAEERPVFEVYVHALRLGLIIVVIGLTYPYGLLAVSAGMGLAEAVASIAGQLLVCRLTGLRLRMIMAAALPGVRVAAVCAVAVLAARLIDSELQLRGILALLPVIALPAVAFCAMEMATVRSLAAAVVARNPAIVSPASVEMQPREEEKHTDNAIKGVFISWAKTMPRTKGLAGELGIHDYYIEYWKGRSRWLLPLRYLRQSLATLAVIRRERPRLIIVTNPPIVLPVIAWVAARWLKAALIIDSHTSAITGKWRRALFLHRFVSRRALLTLVTNGPLRELVSSWGAPAILIEDRMPDLPIAPAAPNNHFTVGVISLVADDEPLSAILAAARSLPEYRFFVTGRIRPQLASYSVRTPLNVTYTGFLTGADYVRLLNQVDTLMVLDTEDNTMLCGAYEAVAVEKPLITSDWPVLRNYFNQGVLYVDNSPQAIEAAVLEAARRKDQLHADIVQLKRSLGINWAVRFAGLRERIDQALGDEGGVSVSGPREKSV